MKRYIAIPAINKQVSIRDYINAIRYAKENPDAEFKHGLTCWWPCTGRDIMKQFLSGIHDRINQNISYTERGV